METDRAGEMLTIRPEHLGRRTETGDTPEDPGRRIRVEGKEVLEEEDEVAPVGFEEGDFPAEGEEDFPVVVVGGGAGVEDVVGDFKTEADIRRRVKIGDVEHVASKTLQTGLSVVSARTQSRMFPNLHRTTPLRTQGMRSNK